MSDLQKIPTLAELVEQTELQKKDDALQLLLNQNPPKEWLSQREIKDGDQKRIIDYLPIARVEYMLTYIYRKWNVEVMDVKLIANSVQVTVRLHVINPVTKEKEYQDGVGAWPIHTKKGAGSTDFNALLANSVMLATPSAKTAAVKDAAEQFGKIFGRDLNRREDFDYSKILIAEPKEDKEDLRLRALIEEHQNDKDFLLALLQTHENLMSETTLKLLNEKI